MSFRRSHPFSHLAQDHNFSLGESISARTRRIFDWAVRRFGSSACAFATRRTSAAEQAWSAGTRPRTGEFRCTAWTCRLPCSGSPRSNGRRLPMWLLCQDMSRLTLPRPVALITCHFDALNHLTDPLLVRRIFESVFRSLRPRGSFLFDALAPYQRLAPQVVNTYSRRRRGLGMKHLTAVPMTWTGSLTPACSSATRSMSGRSSPLKSEPYSRISLSALRSGFPSFGWS